MPTVFLAILASNQAHLLPQFLAYIERLDYPRERISIGVLTDHNIDNTSAMLHEWVMNVEVLYHSVSLIDTNDVVYNSEPLVWNDERYLHIMNLRERSLNEARRQWADFILFVDCDNFLVNPRTLRNLVAQNKSLIAPMLTVHKDSMYSNFWCGTDEHGYYKRTSSYVPTLNRERRGCFPVPMIYGTILIDLRRQGSTRLSYKEQPLNYGGPNDDMLLFAASVKAADLQMYILNDEVYGHLMPTASQYSSVDHLKVYYSDYKMTTLLNAGDIPYTDNVYRPTRPTDNLGFDRVYMINLKRQAERRKRMLSALNELNFEYTVVDAVDGKSLTNEDLSSLKIKPLPGYLDPIVKRKITLGEIGCFLSHYNLWKEVDELELKRVIILEDDLDFEAGFINSFRWLITEADTVVPDWELIYLGRKLVYGNDQEDQVPGADTLVIPNYSYWTLAYTLTLAGARKLLAQRPLEKIIPVDEYLPIMFDKHDM
ncbi:procollagen galactosyltransferase 1-like isoform X2 [Corticium candelabrum]|uniref:procollagen galactosyltransferase 1-like isoform X2 n=1 Tax=Corticium candelabrum TaxID=121492 RepID=UPI002E25AFF9|nr:procollagen galactosyltransferase 1-like isoform X2 [Corticium candelabrum]